MVDRRPERISSLSVEPGLYVLRYVSASGSDHPTIFVRPSPGNEGGLTIIPFPGEPADRMAQPGSLMVISVAQPTMMQITAQAASSNGSLNAELRMEPLKPGFMPVQDADDVGALVPGLSNVPAQAAGSSASRTDDGTTVQPIRRAAAEVVASESGSVIKLRAHLARRGDVIGFDGDWVGGPDAPAPIEGIAVESPSSLGGIQIQVLVAGDSRWSEWLVDGAYGGSRGRASPLVGLRLRLLPAAGVEATMVGEALFLGSAIIRKEGHELEFRSAAGLDPLLGIKLTLRRDVIQPEPEPSLVSTVPQGGRVRVFRASGRRSF